MGNIGSMHRQRNLSFEEFLEAVQVTNERIFSGAFTIEAHEEEQGVSVGINGEDWWTWWRQHRSRFGGKHPNGPSARAWARFLFDNGVAQVLSCRLSNEGMGRSWDPVSDKYSTFASWQKSLYSHMSPDHPAVVMLNDAEKRFFPPQLAHMLGDL